MARTYSLGMKMPIYLDYNSTTPVDERVLEAMLPFFTENFGNASSRQHLYGSLAQAAIRKARNQVAALISCQADEIIFTSGATEAVNLAIRGVISRYAGKKRHIVTSLAEHSAVLDTCRSLERGGTLVTYLCPNQNGVLLPSQLEEAIKPDTALVALMVANNETGVVHPVTDFAAVCHAHNVLFFTDATQAAGKLSIKVDDWQADLLAISAHKLYGPKGTGALYVRRRQRRIALDAQITGGQQEQGMRSGTYNVPGIVGFGEASELALQLMPDENRSLEILRNSFEKNLRIAIPDVIINGLHAERLNHVSNFCLPAVRAADFLMRCPNLAMASGSACASSVPEPSHVLKAMGMSDKLAESAIRISLGRNTTAGQMEEAANTIVEAYRDLHTSA